MQTSLTALTICCAVFGLIFAPSLDSVFAEKNNSVSKPRPQHEDIKGKLKVKGDVVVQKRIADLKIAKMQKETSKNNRELDRQTPIHEKILMQYSMIDDAKQQKEQLTKIMTENFKRVLAKQKHIEKMAKLGNINMHDDVKFEYGKTANDLKKK
jgi:hypothetical protein